MVEHAHVDQTQRAQQFGGDLTIGLTRFGDTRGMVVRIMYYTLVCGAKAMCDQVQNQTSQGQYGAFAPGVDDGGWEAVGSA